MLFDIHCQFAAYPLSVMQVASGAVLPPLPLPSIPHPSSDVKMLSELAAAADLRQVDAQRQQMSCTGDNVSSFGEREAAKGALGRFPGCEVMPIIKGFCQVSPGVGTD